MIQFYTKEFFEELARRLNTDAEWKQVMTGHDMRMICSALDKKRAFLIAVTGGKVSTSEATETTAADYRFEGRYDTWVRLCKGEAEMDRLIEKGKIRFAGRLPDVMGLMGPLNRIVMTARSFEKTY